MTEAATLTLADFLLARCVDDEAEARVIDKGFDWDPRASESSADRGLEWVNPTPEWSDTYRLAIPAARVLAECEAKRRIVESARSSRTFRCEDWADEVLRLLALPYADHPDYRDEWRP